MTGKYKMLLILNFIQLTDTEIGQILRFSGVLGTVYLPVSIRNKWFLRRNVLIAAICPRESLLWQSVLNIEQNINFLLCFIKFKVSVYPKWPSFFSATLSLVHTCKIIITLVKKHKRKHKKRKAYAFFTSVLLISQVGTCLFH